MAGMPEVAVGMGPVADLGPAGGVVPGGPGGEAAGGLPQGLAPPLSTTSGPGPEVLQEWSRAGYPIMLIGMWAGIPAPTLSAMLSHTGIEENDHARTLCDGPPSDFTNALVDFSFNGVGLTFGLRAKIKVMINACRLACGMGPYEPPAPPPTIIYQSPAAAEAATHPQQDKEGTDSDKVDVDDVIQQGKKK